MLTLILGAPGSGKTYYAVDYIYKEYEKHKKGLSKIRFIITNINGLNYDFFDGFVKRYNKKDLENAMEQEYLTSKQNENGEISHNDNYDKWCLDNGIYKDYHNCLIVIDEAYNLFTDKFEDYKGRFLSYHRHFDIDILLLTQSKRQTNRQYIVHTEVTIIAQPSGKRILKTGFRYKIYSTSETKKDNEIETITLRFNSKISSLYNSGSTKIMSSFVGKKLFIILILVLVLYVWFFVLKPPTYSDPTTKDVNSTPASISISQQALQQNSIINLENSPILTTCYPDTCRFNGFTLTLSKDSLMKLLLKHSCEIFIHEQISLNLAHYYINCEVSIYDFLNPFKEVKDVEKTSRSDSKYL